MKSVTVSSRRIKWQKKAAKVTTAVARLNIKELQAEFWSARKAHWVAKKGHQDSSKAFVLTFPDKI